MSTTRKPSQPVRIVGIGHGDKHWVRHGKPTEDEVRFAKRFWWSLFGVLFALGLILKGVAALLHTDPVTVLWVGAAGFVALLGIIGMVGIAMGLGDNDGQGD
jgi:hypothetical protein